MLHLLKRHPIPIRAHFDFVLALTYAAPAAQIRPLLPPGLTADEWNGYGFLAAAFVQTRKLRPAGLPAFAGRSFFLAGYRVFARYTRRDGKRLRGLRILRSDADRRLMVAMGNLLTRYRYRLARVTLERGEGALALRVRTADRLGDAELTARLDGPPGWLPPGSPFADAKQARRFMGPMPFTFGYEPETHSIVRVEGVRRDWRPRTVPVDVHRLDALRHLAPGLEPVLASSFYLEAVDYRWRRGVREPLG